MYIQQDLLMEKNTTVTLKINDLELAGMVLLWMVLEYVWHNLVFKHVGFLCDNKYVVAWAYKGITYTSLPAGHLLRLLSIQKQAR